MRVNRTNVCRKGAPVKTLFLSHVEDDCEIALALSRELGALGYTVWCYENDSLPAVSYLVSTQQAIDACEAFVLLISARSMASHEVDTEIQYAHQKAKLTIPVLLDVSDAAYKRKKPLWHRIVGTATSIEVTAETVPSVARRLAAGLGALGIPGSVAPPLPRAMVEGEEQSQLASMTKDDVQTLAEEARNAPLERTKEVVAQLMGIAERGKQDEVAQEAVFRLGCIGLGDSLPCLFRIADDARRSYSLRQRAMIDLCSILGHGHPHGTFAAMGEWLNWWARNREHIKRQIDERASAGDA